MRGRVVREAARVGIVVALRPRRLNVEEGLHRRVGEIGEAQKDEFLGHAYALLFPIDWPEPFGLVMIEAMACGTPVIAYRNGSVPEVLEDGTTGFVVNGMEAAIAAVERVPEISREQCREVFEERFSARRMAHDYVQVYEHVAAQASGRMPRK